MIRSVGNFIILGLTLLILCATLEWTARIVMPMPKEIDKAWVKRFIHYNNDGFRDRDYSFKKPRGVFRILTLGDSQTFGHGIEHLEDTFPKKLEFLLNNGLNRHRFEVINFARPNWNADSHLRYFFKKGLRYQPDLIILTHYHNDVPTPAFFDCNSKDWKPDLARLPFLARIESLFIYKFLRFRLNRLLEVAGQKPTYEECRKRIYESRGWNMEEMYLDTFVHTARLKRIHFMMAILPVLFKLEEDYPFNFAHKKLSNYCRRRNLECLDLYLGGFEGKKTTELIVSESDRHLNSTGANLTARLIYDRLRPLKQLVHLAHFHQAFDLNDLLHADGIMHRLDEKFEQTNLSPMILSDKARKIMFWSDSGMYYFSDSQFDAKGSQQSMINSILERDGRLVSRENYFYNPISGKLERKKVIRISKEKVQLKEIAFFPKGDFRETMRRFVFNYHSRYLEKLDNFVWELEIQENTRFLDPMTLEWALFFPDKVRLVRPEGKKLEEILNFYLTFPFFSDGSGKAYVGRLAKEVLRIQPSPSAVKVVRKLGF